MQNKYEYSLYGGIAKEDIADKDYTFYKIGSLTSYMNYMPNDKIYLNNVNPYISIDIDKNCKKEIKTGDKIYNVTAGYINFSTSQELTSRQVQLLNKFADNFYSQEPEKIKKYTITGVKKYFKEKIGFDSKVEEIYAYSVKSAEEKNNIYENIKFKKIVDKNATEKIKE